MQIIPEEALELRPNPGPEVLPPEPSWKPWGVLLLLSLITLATAWVGVSWLRRPRPQPQPLPHSWALAELARLGTLSFTNPEALERVHVGLSNVLRRYVSLRFYLQAQEQTTPEFIESLQRMNSMTDAQKAQLAQLLTQLDLVKFAGIQPPVAETEALFAAARKLIQETTPEKRA